MVEAYNNNIDGLSLSKQIYAYREVSDLFGIPFCKDCAETGLHIGDDKALLMNLFSSNLLAKTSPSELLQIIDHNELKTKFPNVSVALRLFFNTANH